ATGVVDAGAVIGGDVVVGGDVVGGTVVGGTAEAAGSVVAVVESTATNGAPVVATAAPGSEESPPPQAASTKAPASATDGYTDFMPSILAASGQGAGAWGRRLVAQGPKVSGRAPI